MKLAYEPVTLTVTISPCRDGGGHGVLDIRTPNSGRQLDQHLTLEESRHLQAETMKLAGLYTRILEAAQKRETETEVVHSSPSSN